MTLEQLPWCVSLSHSGPTAAGNAICDSSIAGNSACTGAPVRQTKVDPLNFRDQAHPGQARRDAVVSESCGQIVQRILACDHEPGTIAEISAIKDFLEDLPTKRRVRARAHIIQYEQIRRGEIIDRRLFLRGFSHTHLAGQLWSP